VLLADAVVSGAAGILMIAGAGILGPLLELPESLLFWAGIVLVPYVALLLVLARRASTSRLLPMDVVLINGLWVAASFGILLSGAIAPNMLGAAFVVIQALAVAALGVLQLAGLKGAAAVAA
jgi:hypothetical protein